MQVDLPLLELKDMIPEELTDNFVVDLGDKEILVAPSFMFHLKTI